MVLTIEASFLHIRANFLTIEMAFGDTVSWALSIVNVRSVLNARGNSVFRDVSVCIDTMAPTCIEDPPYISRIRV